jgi:beta-glucanase (GH16 family)
VFPFFLSTAFFFKGLILTPLPTHNYTKTMKYILLIGLLFGMLAGAFTAFQYDAKTGAVSAANPPKAPSLFEAKPCWADEFSKPGLPDPAKWSYDTGGTGWGNNEWQNYTAGPNSVVKDGFLTITARKEDRGQAHYTSARIVTKGKGDFLYGRFEARIKLPPGRGTWPAFWMLPTDNVYGIWPNSGEIDIMEHVGFNENLIHISTHCKAYYFKLNTQKTDTLRVANVCSQFHLYRVDWTPKAIQGFVDNKLVFTVKNEHAGFEKWPFDKRFHLLLNVAVGGDWGATKGVDDGIFPTSMVVDYVRVYKYKQKV